MFFGLGLINVFLTYISQSVQTVDVKFSIRISSLITKLIKHLSY